jgi:hypothetical protein
MLLPKYTARTQISEQNSTEIFMLKKVEDEKSDYIRHVDELKTAKQIALSLGIMSKPTQKSSKLTQQVNINSSSRIQSLNDRERDIKQQIIKFKEGYARNQTKDEVKLVYVVGFSINMLYWI